MIFLLAYFIIGIMAGTVLWVWSELDHDPEGAPVKAFIAFGFWPLIIPVGIMGVIANAVMRVMEKRKAQP